MHHKRYRKLSPQLYKEAVLACFKNKWERKDVLLFIAKYVGIQPYQMKLDTLNKERPLKWEAVDSIALILQGIVEDLVEYGIEPDDMEPVKVRHWPDGMTGKMRDIALLCIWHQLLGHVAKLMLDPLFHARILPTQHASIPGHGQTRLKNQTAKFFRSDALKIRDVQKTDVVHAYQTTKYSVVIGIIKEELPSAHELHAILGYLEKLAPGGHLIIGGYIDAWLFNFAMSYGLRYLKRLNFLRRDKAIPYIKRTETFMDDFALMSSSRKGLQRAGPALEKWMRTHLQVEIRYTTGIIELIPAEEECRRRLEKSPAKRGVPALDMAGYKISRTHIRIRPRVFKRARRNYMRAWDEYKKIGSISRKRAQALIAYYGYFKQTDSRKAKDKYHVEELHELAKKVSGFYGRLVHMQKLRRLYELQKCRISGGTAESNNGKSAWQNTCKTGQGYRDCRAERDTVGLKRKMVYNLTADIPF